MARMAASAISPLASFIPARIASLAAREGYRAFPIPENVGGRFSVLSAVGLGPAALIGLDIPKLLKGAAAMTHSGWPEDMGTKLALRPALLHHHRTTRAHHAALR